MNSKLKLTLLLLIFCAFLTTILLSAGCNSGKAGPSRPLTASEERGRKIYQANCAVCHSAYKNEALQGPPLVHLYQRDLPGSGSPPTDARVRESIVLGRRNMPGFNLVLTDDQVNDLMAYLHTL